MEWRRRLAAEVKGAAEAAEDAAVVENYRVSESLIAAEAARDAAQEEAAAQQPEGGDEERAEAEEPADPPLEIPTEEDVEAESTRLQELMTSRDETFEKMRGVEGCLSLALYGIPTL